MPRNMIWANLLSVIRSYWFILRCIVINWQVYSFLSFHKTLYLIMATDKDNDEAESLKLISFYWSPHCFCTMVKVPQKSFILRSDIPRSIGFIFLYCLHVFMGLIMTNESINYISMLFMVSLNSLESTYLTKLAKITRNMVLWPFLWAANL